MALIKMASALKNRRRFSLYIPQEEMAGMSRNCGQRKSRNILIGNHLDRMQLFSKASQPRAQDDTHLGFDFGSCSNILNSGLKPVFFLP
jgi:hypothetical protein